MVEEDISFSTSLHWHSGHWGVDHWKTAGVLQSSENSLYTHIRKLALAPPQKIKIGNPVGFQIIEIQNVRIP